MSYRNCICFDLHLHCLRRYVCASTDKRCVEVFRRMVHNGLLRAPRGRTADAAEQIDVERAGSLSFSQKFLTEIRTEGWGITRFGWALGYYSGAWHRSDAGPLDASGKVLTEGMIAIDRSLIPHNADVQISTLPTPWSSKTFKATDVGNGIVGQHIDVFTGTGE